MGDPFRVDAPPVLLTAGRSDLRLLSVDAFSVLSTVPRNKSVSFAVLIIIRAIRFIRLIRCQR